LRKDGAPLWVETQAELMVGMRDTEILAVTRDITARKLAEAALLERQARYEQLFEHVSDGVAVYEAVDAGSDFVFREFNRASEAICGLTRDQVLGQRLTAMFPDVERVGLLDALRRVWRGGAPERLPVASYQDDRFAVSVENYVFRLAGGEVVAIYQDVGHRPRLRDAPPDRP
jgi:PAS domain S-box-containing protein